MRRIIKPFLFVIVFIASISFAGCQCQYGDPGVSITVLNETDGMLEIYIDGLRESSVSPKSSIKFTTIAISPKNVYSDDQNFLFEAKTEEEEVVYSEKYTWRELDDMNWEIEIPSFRNH